MNAHSKKNAGFAIISFLIIAVTLGTISLIPTENNFSFSIINTTQIIAFLIAGICYVWVIVRFTIFSDNETQQNLFSTGFLAFFIFCGLLLLYFINNRFWPMVALSSSCAFLLPYIINQVWHSYNSIFQDVSTVKFGVVEDLKPATDAPEKELKKMPENVVYFNTAKEKENILIPVLKNQELQLKLHEEYEEMRRQQTIQFEKGKYDFETELKKQYDQLIKEERNVAKSTLQEENEKVQKEKDEIISALQQQLQEQTLKKEVDKTVIDEPVIKDQRNSKGEIFDRIKDAQPEPEIARRNNNPFLRITGDALQGKRTPWIYAAPEKEQTPFVFLDSALVYLQIKINIDDKNEQLFSIKVPLDMNLGNAFNYFMNANKKARIQVHDEGRNPYRWKFYSKGFLQIGLNELSPYISLKNNRIKEGKTIVATRAKM